MNEHQAEPAAENLTPEVIDVVNEDLLRGCLHLWDSFGTTGKRAVETLMRSSDEVVATTATCAALYEIQPGDDELADEVCRVLDRLPQASRDEFLVSVLELAEAVGAMPGRSPVV